MPVSCSSSEGGRSRSEEAANAAATSPPGGRTSERTPRKVSYSLAGVGFEKSISGIPNLLPTLLGDAIREEIAALIDLIPTGLNQVTAACPVFP